MSAPAPFDGTQGEDSTPVAHAQPASWDGGTIPARGAEAPAAGAAAWEDSHVLFFVATVSFTTTPTGTTTSVSTSATISTTTSVSTSATISTTSADDGRGAADGESGHEGLGAFVQFWVHEGRQGLDLAFGIWQSQDQEDPSGGDGGQPQVPPKGADGGRQQLPPKGADSGTGGDTQEQDSGSGTVTPAPTGASTSVASRPAASSSGSADSTPAPASTSEPTPAPAAADSGAPAAPTAAAPDSGAPAAPTAAGPVAPADTSTLGSERAVAAASASETTATAAVTTVAHPREATRASEHGNQVSHPDRLAAVGTTGRPAGDTLSGGTAETGVPPAALPKPAAPGAADSATPPREAVPPAPAADKLPSAPPRPEAAAPGGSEQSTAAEAATQEADLLTDLAGGSLQGLGLGVRQSVHRLRNLLGDLAGSVVVRGGAPLLAAGLLGVAYGIVRRRRRKAGRPALGSADKDTDTWVPGPANPPPADQP